MSTRLALALALTALVPGAAAAQLPDPAKSTIPAFVKLVGRIHGGADPDPAGLATVIIRDFTNTPRPGVTVVLDLSGCCDLSICEAVANGQPASFTSQQVSAVTDTSGRIDFIVMGAARDPTTIVPPAEYGGCGHGGGLWVLQNVPEGTTVLGTSTVVCLDQDGAAGGSNGTTGRDVVAVLDVWGANSLGAPYRGRADLDANESLTAADVGQMLGHLGRIALLGGVGCTLPHAPAAGCP